MECSNCKKVFTRKDNLSRHVKRVKCSADKKMKSRSTTYHFNTTEEIIIIIHGDHCEVIKARRAETGISRKIANSKDGVPSMSKSVSSQI